MPQVAEVNPDTPPLPTAVDNETGKPALPDKLEPSRSRSRPPPPPKDIANPSIRRPRNASRSSTGILKNGTINPDLLSPSYVPPPQRKKKVFYQQPLKEQLAMFKHWLKESAKRAKSPTNTEHSGRSNGPESPGLFINGKKHVAEEGSLRRDLTRVSTGPSQGRTSSIGSGPDPTQRQTLPARPRINTNASFESRKRQSLSPHTLTPHSSYRRSSGLRGRKSTSSSVSSILVRIRQFRGTSTLTRRLRRHQAPASRAHLESARHLDHVLQEGRHITPSKCYRRHPQIPHSPLGFVSLAGPSHQPWALCLHSTRPKVLSVAQLPAQVPLACQYSHGESVQFSRAQWPTLLRPAASGAFR